MDANINANINANMNATVNVASVNVNRPFSTASVDAARPVQPSRAQANSRPQAASTPNAPIPEWTSGSNVDIVSANSSAISSAISSANLNVGQNANAEFVLDVPVPYESDKISETVIERYMDTVNQALSMSSFRLNHAVHESTNRIIVRVYDVNTDEVIREIPPETQLEFMSRLQEFKGILFDAVS